MQALKESLFRYIQGVMDGLADAEDGPPPSISERWLQVYRKFRSYFAKDSAKTTSQEVVHRTLQELYSDIQDKIEAEVRVLRPAMDLA